MPLMAAVIFAFMLPGTPLGSQQTMRLAAIPLNRYASSVPAEKLKVAPRAAVVQEQTAVELVSAPSSVVEEQRGLRSVTLEHSSVTATPSALSNALVPVPGMLPAMRPNNPPSKPVHRFWDRTNTIGFAVHGATRVADTIQSCMLLNKPGRKEVWLPTKSCSGIAAYSLSMIPAQIGTSYLMHRRGHHEMERWVPYFWAAPSAAGVAISFKAW